MSRKSVSESWILAAPRFSSSRWSLVVPGIGHDIRPLRQKPGERDLRGRGVLLIGDALQEVHQRLVLLHGLGRGIVSKSGSERLVADCDLYVYRV
jgi:hypothetical protein